MSLWYLARFGDAEVEHFLSPEDMIAYMRLALRRRGVDVRRNSSEERVQTEYMDMVESDGGGPVQWGRADPEIVDRTRPEPLRRRRPRTFVVT